MEKKISEFTCTDGNGRSYTIEEWQEQIPAGHFGNPSATIAGMSRLITSDGMSVNYVDEQTFEIVQTGVIISRA